MQTFQGTMPNGLVAEQHANLLVQGSLSGRVQVNAAAIVQVQGSLTGELDVERGGLLVVQGSLGFSARSQVRGQLQVAGTVQPPNADRLLPAGTGQVLVCPGTLFNVAGTTYLLGADGSLRPVRGNLTINVDSDVSYLAYEPGTNTFRRR